MGFRVPGVPQFATLRGTITGSTGAIVRGTGFTAVRNAAGDYTITFAQAFAEAPSAVATGLGTANRIVVMSARSATAVSFRVRDGAGTAIDPTELDFVAVGPRT
ncbi:MAG: hypothetical protein LC798_15620 [Chloroflexi bacterium]|nr:hypothetical protein [Chloroflexota bacterium]